MTRPSTTAFCYRVRYRLAPCDAREERQVSQSFTGSIGRPKNAAPQRWRTTGAESPRYLRRNRKFIWPALSANGPTGSQESQLRFTSQPDSRMAFKCSDRRFAQMNCSHEALISNESFAIEVLRWNRFDRTTRSVGMAQVSRW